MLVVMIRASNFPVLLCIALYERQRYRDTTLAEQLGDFAEKYVGSLPRRLKAAGEPDNVPSGCSNSSAAGFENSRRDIGAVFEIEREVGSFYTGWDDDADADIDDVGESELPILDLDEPEEDATASPRRDSTGEPVHSSSVPYTASPGRVESIRSRRSSMPASPSPRISPTDAPGPTGRSRPDRPRRNSSIQDPSPLARLFISPSPELPKRLRDKRHSMLHSMSMSSSGSQPILSSLVSPIRKHTRIPSLSSVPERIKRVAHIHRPSVGTIEEGRKVSFKAQEPIPFPISPVAREEGTPTRKIPSRAPALSKSPEVIHIKEESTETLREPTQSTSVPQTHTREATTETSFIIGKASEVAEEIRDSSNKEDEWRVRLDKIDERQQRIEKMLARLVGDKYADVFSADEGSGRSV